MQIRTKLIALSGCGLLAVGSLVFVFHSSLGKIGAATDSMTTISSALRNHLEGDMMHDAIKGDVLAAQLAKTDADFAAVNKDLADHAEWFRKCLSANKELELPSEVKTALADAQPALDQYILAAETIIAQRKFDEASLTNFNAAFSHLEEANEKLSDLIETAVQTAGANQSGTRSTANITSLILAAASGVVFGLISFMTGRSIVTSLTALRATLTKFAQGDLSDRMDTSSNDELAQVATEANNMADSMSKMVEQIRAASEQVAAAAQEIEASGQEVRRQTDDQVAKIEQLEAALTEFSQGTEQVAAKSTEATSTAEQSGRAATEGGDVVNEALAGMKTIDTTVTESATLIQDLGKRGEQIGEIIRVIDDIAEQTNLLALNAAIEAARAGDHGRGFAVVADEVRKLADRTTKATEEIGRSITAIREQTGRAVEQMGMGTTRVREGVERAQTARERLEEIVSGTNNVSSMIGSIAAAAEQQRAATRSVLDGITEITTSSRAVRDGANESAQAATLLADNATRMRDLVNRFKVAPERSKS